MREIFENIFVKYYARLLLYALKVAKSFGLTREDAEDAVQESFIALWEVIEAGIIIPEIFFWCCLVIKRKLLNLKTRKTTEAKVLTNILLKLIQNIDDEATLDNEKEILRPVIEQKLTPPEIKIFKLRLEGKKYEEIAKIIEITEVNARKKVFDITCKLRAYFSRTKQIERGNYG